MIRTARSASLGKLVVVLVVAAVAVCALVVVAALPARGPSEPARVCVSSATASVRANGTVVATESIVDCVP